MSTTYNGNGVTNKYEGNTRTWNAQIAYTINDYADHVDVTVACNFYLQGSTSYRINIGSNHPLAAILKIDNETVQSFPGISGSYKAVYGSTPWTMFTYTDTYYKTGSQQTKTCTFSIDLDYPSAWHGDSSVSITGGIVIPAIDAPPTFTAVTSSTGSYFKNVSTYTATISNLDPKYGATISSVVLTLGSQTASRTTNGALSIAVNATGTFTPTIVATDSRGQSTTKTLTAITVSNHSEPTLTATVSSSGPYYVGATPYKVTITNASAKDGTSISSIKLTVGSQNTTRTTNGELSITPSTAGSFTPTVVITDSVGVSKTYTLTAITVYANTVPTCTATVSSSAPYYVGATPYKVTISSVAAYNSKTVSSVKLTLGSQTTTGTENGGLSITPNATLSNAIPTVVITDNIGASKTYSLSAVTVYANTAPSFNAATSTSGNYYAGVTNYSVTISNASAYNSKTIAQTKLTIGSQSVTGTGNGTLTIKVSTAGTFTPVVTVTDNIGASTSQNMSSLTVLANTPPSATVTVNNQSPYYEGVAARGYSVTLSNVTPYNSKTITQTKLTVGSQTATGTGNGTLSITLNTAGTFTPVVTITDSQGAVTTYTQSAITVNTRIAEASITKLERITSAGALDNEGTNAVLSATFTYSKFTGNYLTQPTVAINGTTTSNATWYTGWTSSGGFTGAVSWSSYQPNSPVTLYAKLTSTFAIDTSYVIFLTPKTTNKTGTAVTGKLSQAFYLLAGKAGGHALGIGKKPTADNLLDIGMATSMDGNLTVAQKFSTKYENSLLTGGAYTAAVTTSPYKPLKWSFNKGINPTNGDMVVIQTPSAGHDYGVFLSLDNGSNYHPIAHSGNNRLTTHYGNGSPLLLVYDSDWQCNSVFPLDGGTARVNVIGSWRVINGYLDGNTYPQCYCSTAAATAAKAGSMSSYVATANRYVMVNMVYANSSAGAITLNINGTGAKPIYINGAASSSSNYTLPAGSYLVFYNGTNYYFRTDGYIQAPLVTTTVPTFSAAPTSGQIVTADGTNGRVKTSGYTIATSVPSSAVFTDTKNTAGSTDSSSKLFLIGATSQAANPQTYSHDTAYVGTDGCLYSGGAKVLTSIANNITGSGTSGKLAKFNGTNTLTGGPTVTISTSAPTSSDGANGDIWLVYS